MKRILFSLTAALFVLSIAVGCKESSTASATLERTPELEVAHEKELRANSVRGCLTYVHDLRTNLWFVIYDTGDVGRGRVPGPAPDVDETAQYHLPFRALVLGLSPTLNEELFGVGVSLDVRITSILVTSSEAIQLAPFCLDSSMVFISDHFTHSERLGTMYVWLSLVVIALALAALIAAGFSLWRSHIQLNINMVQERHDREALEIFVLLTQYRAIYGTWPNVLDRLSRIGDLYYAFWKLSYAPAQPSMVTIKIRHCDGFERSFTVSA